MPKSLTKSAKPEKSSGTSARTPTGAPAGTVQRPNRWDEPFSRDMTDEQVAVALTHEPFVRMNEEKFPRKLGLRGILKNDCRIRTYRNGEVIVREGDYGSSAFVIFSGAVRVVLTPSLPPKILGRRKPAHKGVWGTLTQVWSRSKQPEVRDVTQDGRPSTSGAKNAEAGAVPRVDGHAAIEPDRIILQDLPTVLARHKTAKLSVYEGTIKEGNLFGEIGALGRLPRSATVFADGDATLLEIRWQGLRDIMRSAPETREHVEKTFRENMFAIALRTHPLFDRNHLSDDALQKIADASSFQMHGQFDWYGSYRKLMEKDADARLRAEPVIAAEGHYPNGVVLILAGFARMSQHHGNGERTVSYLGNQQLFGHREVYHNWKDPERLIPLQHTLRAVGYLNALFVPTPVLEQYVFPSLPEAQRPDPIHSASSPHSSSFATPKSQTISTDMLEFLVESRVINGTKTMVIDLNRCTRCDDCVRACAAAHDNNPRFVRHGNRNGQHMIVNACMHCADPVCMIGCPTGAIHRMSDGGDVVINDLTCIGCQLCANNCPYDNIRMVQIRDRSGATLVDDRELPILKATKCDFCVDQVGGPACERACPHDALVRLDTSRVDPLAEWLKK